MVADGYIPYVDSLHIDEFYQKKVELHKKGGYFYFNKIKRAHVKKCPKLS